MSDIKKILKNNKIDMNKFQKAFKYPFSFMKGGDNYDPIYKYDYNQTCMTMFNNKMKSEKIDMSNVLFSRDIVNVFWYEEGENDVSPWYFIGKIKCNDKFKFIYYIGECDYTGFDCQGDMRIYISSSLQKIIDLAIEYNVIEKIRQIQKNIS
jgi:hypothetical protein